MAKPQFKAKLSTWLLYGVGAALLPILFIFLERWADGQSIRPSRFLSSGDLILISVVLTTAALGDFLLSQEGRPWSVFARTTGFLGCVVPLIGAWLFGRISSRTLEQVADQISANGHPASAQDLVAAYQAAHNGVMWQSLVVFVVSFGVGFAMVRLSTLEGGD